MMKEAESIDKVIAGCLPNKKGCAHPGCVELSTRNHSCLCASQVENALVSLILVIVMKG